MPFFSRQKCLYHFNHDLISFCKCQSCYLPVCEVCVKIHKNQHKMYQTEPIFENLNFVLNQVHEEISKQLGQIKQLTDKLSQVPRQLQKKQSNLKQQFKLKRQKIISSFQTLVLSLEDEFINDIKRQEFKYIEKLQSLQRQIYMMNQTLTGKLQNIQQNGSKNRMETIIEFYTNRSRTAQTKQFQLIENEVQSCKNAILQTNLNKIDQMHKIIKKNIQETPQYKHNRRLQ